MQADPQNARARIPRTASGWECIGYGTPESPYERQPLPSDCMGAAVQAGPGLYGYYPLLDRSGGGRARPAYYLQIALQESYGLSGIPEYAPPLHIASHSLLLCSPPP